MGEEGEVQVCRAFSSLKLYSQSTVLFILMLAGCVVSVLCCKCSHMQRMGFPKVNILSEELP